MASISRSISSLSTNFLLVSGTSLALLMTFSNSSKSFLVSIIASLISFSKFGKKADDDQRFSTFFLIISCT